MKLFLKCKIKEAIKQVQEQSELFNNDKNIAFYRGVRDAYLYLYRNPNNINPDNLMKLYVECKAKQTNYYDGACTAYKLALERLVNI